MAFLAPRRASLASLVLFSFACASAAPAQEPVRRAVGVPAVRDASAPRGPLSSRPAEPAREYTSAPGLATRGAGSPANITSAPPSGASGSVDASYGSAGTAHADFDGPTDDGAKAALVQPDGKILVAAGAADSYRSYLTVVRLGLTGRLDPFFGTNGVVRIDTPTRLFGEAWALALQPDGRIVVAGYAFAPGSAQAQLVVARLGANGSLDATFGTGGVAVVDPTPAVDVPNAIALQTDGKIVVAGYAYDGDTDTKQSEVARLTAAGALDTGFGTGGAVTFAIGPNSESVGVAIQGDGKIVVGESASPGAFTIARLDAAGAFDPTFGSGGVATAPYANVGSGDVVIRSDGRIAQLGSVYDPAAIAFAQFLPDGSLDAAFGTGGVALVSGYALGFHPKLLLQGDGSLVAAGMGTGGSINGAVVARVTPAGQPDTSLGGTGAVAQSGWVTNSPWGGAALGPNGRIVVSGARVNTLGDDVQVARFLPTGAPDRLFGPDGRTALDLRGKGYARPIDSVLQPDGKLVTLSSTKGNEYGADDFALVRFLPTGAPDPTFGSNGRVLTDVGRSNYIDLASSLAVQNDGKLFAAGSVYLLPQGLASGVVRYLPNGMLDPRFGSAGRVVLPLDRGYWIGATGLAVQSDGKVLVADLDLTETYEPVIKVTRLLASGAIDRGFGSNGTASTTVHYAEGKLNVAVRGDGRILVGLSLQDYDTSAGGVLLLQLDRNGHPDASFGTAGVAQTWLPATYLYVAAMRLQRDGRAVVSGLRVSGDGASSDALLARFTTAGAADSTFGVAGFADGDFGTSESAYGLVIQRDDKLVVTGGVPGAAEDTTLLFVARYDRNGVRDASFGGDGHVALDVEPGGETSGVSVVQTFDAKLLVTAYDYLAYRVENVVVTRLFGR